jgi:cytidylate kinase
MGAISDTAPTIAAIAPLAGGPTTLHGIGFIRAKETDRIAAVVTELRRLGVDAIEEDDGLTVRPGAVHGGVVRTYDDHRMAMSFSVLGLKVPGVVIDEADVVDKTFPRFFDVLEQLRVPAGDDSGAAGSGAGRGVVAIDGPAGSGKSTVAKALSHRLGVPYLDTGAMYRAATWAALRDGVGLHDEPAVADLCRRMDLELSPSGVWVDGVDVTSAIRGSDVNEGVSIVAAHPGVRADMRVRQRAWMAEHGGGVVEGRDIGTVVFPDASVKVYLNASPLARARRRATERNETDETDVQRTADELARRDHLDSTRTDSPLQEAADAMVIDTTDLTVDEVVARVVERYEEEMGRGEHRR